MEFLEGLESIVAFFEAHNFDSTSLVKKICLIPGSGVVLCKRIILAITEELASTHRASRLVHWVLVAKGIYRFQNRSYDEFFELQTLVAGRLRKDFPSLSTEITNLPDCMRSTYAL